MRAFIVASRGIWLRAGWLLAVATALLPGCLVEPDYPPLVEEEWPFRIYSNAPLSTCAMELNQAHYARWSELLGFSMKPDQFIDILVHEPSYATEYCTEAIELPRTASACATEGRVVSAVAYHPHELTHVEAIEGLGRTVALLSEGLASLGECSGDLSTTTPEYEANIYELIRTHDFRYEPRTLGPGDPGNYGVAESFVAHLVRDLGWETFGAIYRALDRKAGFWDVHEVFLRKTGRPFSAFVVDWTNGEKMSQYERCALVTGLPEPLLFDVEYAAECFQARLERGGAEAEAPGVAEMGFSRSFTLARPSVVTLQLRGGHGVWIQLFDDDTLDGGDMAFPSANESDRAHEWVLPAGTFRIDAWDNPHVPLDDSDVLTYSLSATPLPADPCALEPTNLSEAGLAFSNEFAPAELQAGGVDFVVPFTVDAPAPAEIFTLPAEAPAWLCEDICVAGPPCAPLSYEDGDYFSVLETTLLPGTTYRLVVTRPDADQRLYGGAELITPP